ncbi:MAG: ABC transporter ATP-binding protein [Anaerolineae bacterium]|jgi:ATP-binding cassette subfamily B multidrug efflux pump
MNNTLRLLRYLKPHWRLALAAPLLMLVEVAMDLVQPSLLQRIIDQALPTLDLTIILKSGALMLAAASVGAVGGLGCTIAAMRAALRTGGDLRQALFRQVQSFSFANLDELETGQLVTRLTSDVTAVEQLTQMALRMMVRAPLLLVGSLIMSIITAPSLAWVFFAFMPLLLMLVWWVVVRARPMFRRVQSSLDRVNETIQENLSGIRVVKAFVRRFHEDERFARVNENLMHISVRAFRMFAIVFPSMMLIVNGGVVVALYRGGAQVVRGDMHIGQLMAFVNYLMMALREVLFFGMMVSSMSRAEASAERICEVLDTKSTVVDRADATADFQPQGRVAFENVSFAYDGPGSEPVLDGISFTAEPGSTVALLGATGSGKTTLVNLIPRFYDVTGGRVTIDGIDVRDVQQSALRRAMGIALQEPILFTGTIRENISYGRPDATDQEVIAAAKAAQAHDFIMSFPDGYDSLIGQRGVNVSGGQKQRIAIARALLAKPAILILDDSTSSVDVDTEARIQEALEELMAERTSFVIAQRVSTVLNADKILVLDGGRLAAEGTHRELLASSPIYREIYDSQLGNGVNGNGSN